jgi:DNA-binding Lrp family transcriptional regulator
VQDPQLTERTVQVLQYLLARPTVEVAAVDVAGGVGMPAATASAIVARLVELGVLTQRYEANNSRRPVRFAPGAEARCRELLGSGVRPPAAGPRPVEDDGRVWTLREIRAAVKSGVLPRAVLQAVERELRNGQRSQDEE